MDNEIKIGKKTISLSSNVYMIAEIGINHNGDMTIVKRLLDAAYACGWHCGKFQKRDPDICVPEEQKKKIVNTPWGEMTYLEYKKKIEFTKKDYDIINSYCKMKPLDWTASAWDKNSLRFLLNYEIPFIKIASASLTNKELIKACAVQQKPVLLSTGMSTIEEIDSAVEVFKSNGKKNLILMHTNSAYPAPNDELNLSVIPFLRQRYKCLVGYSGHEKNLEPSVVAVALGARVIERHITIDHNMWGTDQAASLEVHAMDMLRKRIEGVVSMLGDGVKRITSGELAVRKKLRKIEQ